MLKESSPRSQRRRRPGPMYGAEVKVRCQVAHPSSALMPSPQPVRSRNAQVVPPDRKSCALPAESDSLGAPVRSRSRRGSRSSCTPLRVEKAARNKRLTCLHPGGPSRRDGRRNRDSRSRCRDRLGNIVGRAVRLAERRNALTAANESARSAGSTYDACVDRQSQPASAVSRRAGLRVFGFETVWGAGK